MVKIHFQRGCFALWHFLFRLVGPALLARRGVNPTATIAKAAEAA